MLLSIATRNCFPRQVAQVYFNDQYAYIVNHSISKDFRQYSNCSFMLLIMLNDTNRSASGITYVPDLTMFPYGGDVTRARILVPASICDVSVHPPQWSAGEDFSYMLFTTQELFFNSFSSKTNYVGTFRCVKLGCYSSRCFQRGIDEYVRSMISYEAKTSRC